MPKFSYFFSDRLFLSPRLTFQNAATPNEGLAPELETTHDAESQDVQKRLNVLRERVDAAKMVKIEAAVKKGLTELWPEIKAGVQTALDQDKALDPKVLQMTGASNNERLAKLSWIGGKGMYEEVAKLFRSIVFGRIEDIAMGKIMAEGATETSRKNAADMLLAIMAQEARSGEAVSQSLTRSMVQMRTLTDDFIPADLRSIFGATNRSKREALALEMKKAGEAAIKLTEQYTIGEGADAEKYQWSEIKVLVGGTMSTVSPEFLKTGTFEIKNIILKDGPEGSKIMFARMANGCRCNLFVARLTPLTEGQRVQAELEPPVTTDEAEVETPPAERPPVTAETPPAEAPATQAPAEAEEQPAETPADPNVVYLPKEGMAEPVDRSGEVQSLENQIAQIKANISSLSDNINTWQASPQDATRENVLRIKDQFKEGGYDIPWELNDNEYDDFESLAGGIIAISREYGVSLPPNLTVIFKGQKKIDFDADASDEENGTVLGKIEAWARSKRKTLDNAKLNLGRKNRELEQKKQELEAKKIEVEFSKMRPVGKLEKNNERMKFQTDENDDFVVDEQGNKIIIYKNSEGGTREVKISATAGRLTDYPPQIISLDEYGWTKLHADSGEIRTNDEAVVNAILSNGELHLVSEIVRDPVSGSLPEDLKDMIDGSVTGQLLNNNALEYYQRNYIPNLNQNPHKGTPEVFAHFFGYKVPDWERAALSFFAWLKGPEKFLKEDGEKHWERAKKEMVDRYNTPEKKQELVRYLDHVITSTEPGKIDFKAAVISDKSESEAKELYEEWETEDTSAARKAEIVTWFQENFGGRTPEEAKEQVLDQSYNQFLDPKYEQNWNTIQKFCFRREQKLPGFTEWLRGKLSSYRQELVAEVGEPPVEAETLNSSWSFLNREVERTPVVISALNEISPDMLRQRGGNRGEIGFDTEGNLALFENAKGRFHVKMIDLLPDSAAPQREALHTLADTIRYFRFENGRVSQLDTASNGPIPAVLLAKLTYLSAPNLTAPVAFADAPNLRQVRIGEDWTNIIGYSLGGTVITTENKGNYQYKAGNIEVKEYDPKTPAGKAQKVIREFNALPDRQISDATGNTYPLVARPYPSAEAPSSYRIYWIGEDENAAYDLLVLEVPLAQADTGTKLKTKVHETANVAKILEMIAAAKTQVVEEKEVSTPPAEAVPEQVQESASASPQSFETYIAGLGEKYTNLVANKDYQRHMTSVFPETAEELGVKNVTVTVDEEERSLAFSIVYRQGKTESQMTRTILMANGFPFSPDDEAKLAEVTEKYLLHKVLNKEWTQA